MNVEAEVWMIIVTAAAAVIPWAFSIHAKVAVIASAVESLPQVVEEMRQALQEHEDRLDEHAQEIQTLKKASATGG